MSAQRKSLEKYVGFLGLSGVLIFFFAAVNYKTAETPKLQRKLWTFWHSRSLLRGCPGARSLAKPTGVCAVRTEHQTGSQVAACPFGPPVLPVLPK